MEDISDRLRLQDVAETCRVPWCSRVWRLLSLGAPAAMRCPERPGRRGRLGLLGQEHRSGAYHGSGWAEGLALRESLKLH